nr:RNA-directed DNA polymerase, eukaryota [Tanacetum cinerariifolium]
MIIDKGNASKAILTNRMEVCNSIQDLDKLHNMEVAQKAKIKWTVEGDENSKFFHGILNKKRAQLAIRGVMKDGVWEENPEVIKMEFLNHFRTRFEQPTHQRPMINMEFPNHLNSSQAMDLEAGKQSFVLKVDYEKAYDYVRWDYLCDILRKFGFGNRWCGWIHECLRTSRGSVLVNGSPTEEFQFFKGLKQGDPRAPFLFILVMESLHISFTRVVEAGLFQGVEMFPISLWVKY